jgi:hypothetical protein
MAPNDTDMCQRRQRGIRTILRVPLTEHRVLRRYGPEGQATIFSTRVMGSDGWDTTPLCKNYDEVYHV